MSIIISVYRIINRAPNEVIKNLCRAYLKNDLFYFAGIIQSQNQKNNKPKDPQKDNEHRLS